jgi:exopolysaccharide production protein ExoZ
MCDQRHLKKDIEMRLYALDICRGVCALGVAAYHFSLWGGTVIPRALHSVLSLFGTYGVSVFFILSGYSLAHAYNIHFSGQIESTKLIVFIRRRIGRLAPLFISVVILTVAGKAVLGGKFVDPLTLLANLTLLFGFANPASSPVIGGWSIGVEVVFYLIFPLLLVLRKQVILMFLASVLLTAWVSADIARLDTLANGWEQYVSPANHWVFFCAGVYARLHSHIWRISTRCVQFLIWIALSVTIVACLGATELQIVTGWYRVLFTVLSIILVALLGRISVRDEFLQKFSAAMGGASYSLYLIHPLVFFGMLSKIDITRISVWAVCVMCTLVLSYFVDRYLDSKVQRSLKRMGW